MPCNTVEERAEMIKKRSDMGGKLLKEKGDSMNRAEKAFVKTFVKNDKYMKDK